MEETQKLVLQKSELEDRK